MLNAGVTESATNRHLYADIDGNGSADLVAWDAAEDGATRVFLARAALPAETRSAAASPPSGTAAAAGPDATVPPEVWQRS